MISAVVAYSWRFLGFGFPGGYEWVILLILGLLIFGRRLPEVGRSLGKGIVEFKRGIKGIEGDIEDESSRPAALEPPAPTAAPPPPPAPARQPDASPPNVVARSAEREPDPQSAEADGEDLAAQSDEDRQSR